MLTKKINIYNESLNLKFNDLNKETDLKEIVKGINKYFNGAKSSTEKNLNIFIYIEKRLYDFFKKPNIKTFDFSEPAKIEEILQDDMVFILMDKLNNISEIEELKESYIKLNNLQLISGFLKIQECK